VLGIGLLATATVRPQVATIRAHSYDGSSRAFTAQRGAGVSLQQAIAIARSRYAGRVIRAERSSRGDRVIYEIRILADHGRVRTVRIDAKTGQFL
jgi:uncharacterized membrane protein YkoI